MILRNTEATVCISLVSAADGNTPMTSGSPSIVVSKDGGTQAALATSATHIGSGQWLIDLTATEMDAVHIGGQISLAGAITRDFNIHTVPQNTFSQIALIAAMRGTNDALLASGYTQPPTKEAIAIETDARLLDAGDATDLIASIVSRLGNTNVDEASLVGLIRADIERAGGRLAALSTHSGQSEIIAPSELIVLSGAPVSPSSGIMLELRLRDEAGALVAPDGDVTMTWVGTADGSVFGSLDAALPLNPSTGVYTAYRYDNYATVVTQDVVMTFSWVRDGAAETISHTYRQSNDSLATIASAVSVVDGVVGDVLEDTEETLPAAIAGVDFPLSGDGLANFETFFDNGDALTAKTIDSLTSIKNITITIP